MHLADAFIQSDLQLHSGYTFSLVCVPWESNPQPFATQEHFFFVNTINVKITPFYFTNGQKVILHRSTLHGGLAVLRGRDTGRNSSERLGGGEAAAGVLEDDVPLPPATGKMTKPNLY